MLCCVWYIKHLWDGVPLRITFDRETDHSKPAYTGYINLKSLLLHLHQTITFTEVQYVNIFPQYLPQQNSSWMNSMLNKNTWAQFCSPQTKVLRLIKIIFVSADEEQSGPGQESCSWRWLCNSSWTTHSHQHLLQRYHEYHHLPEQPQRLLQPCQGTTHQDIVYNLTSEQFIDDDQKLESFNSLSDS